MIEQAEQLGNTLQTMIQSINQEEQADEDVPYLPPAVGAVVQPTSPHEMDVDYFGKQLKQDCVSRMTSETFRKFKRSCDKLVDFFIDLVKDGVVQVNVLTGSKFQ